MGKLYEKCPLCRAGEVEPEKRLPNGECPGCAGHLFVAIGPADGQVRSPMGAIVIEGEDPGRVLVRPLPAQRRGLVTTQEVCIDCGKAVTSAALVELAADGRLLGRVAGPWLVDASQPEDPGPQWALVLHRCDPRVISRLASGGGPPPPA